MGAKLPEARHKMWMWSLYRNIRKIRNDQIREYFCLILKSTITTWLEKNTDEGE